MQKILKDWIKKIFSDSHSAIVGIALGSLFAGGTGIYFFAKNLWLQLMKIMQTPTPLWATIALVLLVALYIQIKTKINLGTFCNLPVTKTKIKFYDVGGYRWKATIHRPDYFELDKYPYCPIHDTRFIYGNDRKFCPGNDQETCKENISKRDEFVEYEAAKSIIESKIRNEVKC